MKIIVDKIPESCAKCIFHRRKIYHVGDRSDMIGLDEKRERCIILEKHIPDSVCESMRLNNCPLISLGDKLRERDDLKRGFNPAIGTGADI